MCILCKLLHGHRGRLLYSLTVVLQVCTAGEVTSLDRKVCNRCLGSRVAECKVWYQPTHKGELIPIAYVKLTGFYVRNYWRCGVSATVIETNLMIVQVSISASGYRCLVYTTINPRGASLDCHDTRCFAVIIHNIPVVIV